ncbi:hypothetical protein [Thermococcus sp. JCM 11816]|uniref:hypothetical protein n=1 Tax=Thermococcus sp. (strain JCM 11816 / KS-1) TaxID=1295125 RepID=UPI003467467F
MAVYAGFAYPEVFRYVGAMSSAFWFNPEIYDFVRNAEKGPEKIYIDWGTMEGERSRSVLQEQRGDGEHPEGEGLC